MKSMAALLSADWQWENAIAGATAGLATVTFSHSLDVVRTRFQVYDGRISNVPAYRNTPHALFSIARNALRTIIKEEGWRALYKGLMPGLFLVTHGAIQFTAYEEFRKVLVSSKAQENENPLATAADLLDSVDYATLGASSKLAAILTTYPFQVVRSRLQQRPSTTGVPRYMDSWHVVKETARFEGVRGFYRGMTANVLKNAPAASITFIVYENVLNLLKLSRREY